jgi:hypothetical protein
MSLVAAPQCCLARSAAGPAALRRANPVRAAAASSARLTRRSARVATSAVLSPDQAVQAITDGHAALFQLSANANDLVDGCGVNGTCGQVGLHSRVSDSLHGPHWLSSGISTRTTSISGLFYVSIVKTYWYKKFNHTGCHRFGVCCHTPC